MSKTDKKKTTSNSIISRYKMIYDDDHSDINSDVNEELNELEDNLLKRTGNIQTINTVNTDKEIEETEVDVKIIYNNIDINNEDIDEKENNDNIAITEEQSTEEHNNDKGMVDNIPNELPTKSLLNVNIGMNIYKINMDKLIDAPVDWNFFPELDDNKIEELINSIQDNGLLVPLVVWDQDNGKYMILSGHNRKRAYDELFKRTGDNNYKSIYCTIKGKDEIDNDDAKTIIIDTNFVQRELTTSLKTKCIIEKYQAIGRKTRNSNEKSAADTIAEEYNISRKWVFTYYKLKNLIPEIMKMIDDNIISIKAGKVLSNLSKDLQHKLFYNYGGFLNNKRILKIDTTQNEDNIINNLISYDKLDNDYIKVTSTIPKGLYDNFVKYVDQWLKKNTI